MKKIIEIVYSIFTAVNGLSIPKAMMDREVKITMELFEQFIIMAPPKDAEDVGHIAARFIAWVTKNHGSDLISERGDQLYNAFVHVCQVRHDLVVELANEIQQKTKAKIRTEVIAVPGTGSKYIGLVA